MAEPSLDDFFAKKDKSKKKSKGSKLVPADILAKSDETVKKEKKKKEKDAQNSAKATKNNNTIGPIVNPEEEEEWKEVEEEKEKDYTGLRIANLQVSEKEAEAEEENGEDDDEENSDGETKEKKDSGQQGPWKGAAPVAAPHPTQTAPTPPPPQEEETAKSDTAPKTPGKYIPPGQRAAAAGGYTQASGPTLPSHIQSRKAKKAAPNITSEMDFPTLGGGMAPVPVDSDTRNFEKVQYGGRQAEDPSKSQQSLSLGNKFSALQD